MNDRSGVLQQIRKIKDIFESALQLATTEDDTAELKKGLEESDAEFRSVAYEGASMGMALKDIARDGTLSRWNTLLDGPGAAHATQIHVGLGWALAQEAISVSPFRKGIDPLLWFRVGDGYGYYEGFFRSRRAIKNHQWPAELPNEFDRAYDQGIGRSLWYVNQGIPEKIIPIIGTFSPSRQVDLWRGVGIACAYVGGYEKKTLAVLWESAFAHRAQLAIGAALAARARTQAICMTGDGEDACRSWCNRSAAEAVAVTIESEQHTGLKPEDSFSTWIRKMELAFA